MPKFKKGKGHIFGRHNKCNPQVCEVSARKCNELISKYQEQEYYGVIASGQERRYQG